MYAIGNSSIREIKIEIDKDEVCRYLGYEGKQNLPSSRSSLIDNQIEVAYKLIEPSSSFIIKKTEKIQPPHTFLEGYLIFTSKTISQLVSKCYEVIIFLITIGNRLEEEVSQLMEGGEVLKATILDAVGSEAAEKTADSLEEHIRNIALAHNAEISLRFSPGYCDWDISEQEKIFNALDSDSLGVDLTEGYLMVPQKSISGIIGIGDNVANFNPCRLCKRENCPFRRNML
jgi:hypothetical protein